MNATTLAHDTVRFFSADAPAHRARLFEWEGGLYRAVRPAHAEFFESLRQGGVFDKLHEAGLLAATDATPLRVEGYGPVYRHTRAPFVTYPFEWPAQALRDAALAFLDLNLALAEHGAATCDAHAWNTVFFGHKPVFVDLGSITPLERASLPWIVREFEGSYLRPLLLMAAGQHRIARSLLRDHGGLIDDREWRLLSGRPGNGLLAPVMKLVSKAARRLTPGASDDARAWRRTLGALRRRVEAVELPRPATDWAHYYDQFPSLTEPAGWTRKQAEISSLLRQLRPGTVHDVGSNRGWYGQHAATLGAAVIATDRDEAALDQLYLDTRRRGLNVTCAHLDMTRPAPAYGWNVAQYPSAVERFRADCVMALAVVHHLVFKAMADFPRFYGSLASMTRRDLVTEFVSSRDRHVATWDMAGRPWYTLEEFAAAARERFDQARVEPAHAPGRNLLVCSGPRDGARGARGLAA